MDPQEIENVEFKTTRLKEGYDPDEVDAFLDRVAQEFAQVAAVGEARRAEVVRLKAELAQAKADNTPTQNLSPIVTPGTAAAALLDAAQKTAERLQADAEQQGQALVAKAQQDATEVSNRARMDEFAVRERVEALKEKHEVLRQFLKQHLSNGLEELEANPNG